MAQSPGGRGGNVTTRFPVPSKPAQVNPKDASQYETPKGNKTSK